MDVCIVTTARTDDEGNAPSWTHSAFLSAREKGAA